MKKILNRIKSWWKRNIIDYVPKEIEDIEFSEKYRRKNGND